MKTIKLLLFTFCIAPLLIIDTAQSATHNQCTQIQIHQIYLQQPSNSENNTSISDVYKAQISALNDFAVTQQLNKFKIEAIPLDVDASNKAPERSEIIISMKFEENNDASLMDKINAELRPLKFSYSALLSKNILCEV